MATWPTVQSPDTSENVRTVQYLLNAHGANVSVDGSFGAATKTAVKNFQTAHQLTSDGIVGNATWPKLVVQVNAPATGPAVRAAQSQIHSRIQGWVTVDGTFGPQTTEVVKGFQGPIGLNVDGIVGPQTWNRLVSRYLVATDSEKAAKRVFEAWKADDAPTAHMHATSDAVSQLFAHSWAPNTWTFANAQGAAGTVYVTWTRSGGHELVLAVNNNAGAPFFWVKQATFS
ncbi:MAG: hypothetical protein QOJ46_96 [bacterium]|jgi:murein L,D-transpeptidase YcbB/YkuD